MKHGTYAVYDSKAKCYLPPFTIHRAEMAQRIFSDCINSTDHQWGKHPADYTLFEVGIYDDETGLIKPYEAPVTKGNGLQYVQIAEDQQDLFLTEEQAETIGQSNGS